MSLLNLRRWRLLRAARRGVQHMRARTVREVMTDYVVTIAPEKNVADAAAIMVGEDLSTLVVEQGDKPVGILTERDFLDVPASSKGLAYPLKRVMSDKVQTVSPDTTLMEALALMTEKNIRKLVVVRKDGKIAGIVTQTDLSRELYNGVRVVVALDEPFLVRDVMSEKLVSVPKEAPFEEAKRRMTKHGISAVPVTEGKECVGILTEYDVVAQYYDAQEITKKRAGDVMTSPLKVIPGELNLFEANMIMLLQKVRRLVVTEGEDVVGIITQTDVVRRGYAYLASMAKLLKEDAASATEDRLLELKRRHAIISEYAGKHKRAYTVKAS